MTSEWEALAEWWTGEVADDPAYRQAVLPLAERLCPATGMLVELGCGEGQVMRHLGTDVRRIVGVDLNPVLASAAAQSGPVVRARLPDVRCFRPQAFDGALLVLVLEHIDPLEPALAAIREIVRPGGALVVIANHPVLTAPGAAAVIDPTDGEEFWRWGSYLSPGQTAERAGEELVTFFHRPIADVLSAAASTGWELAEAAEVGWVDDAIGPPRLLGLRWRRDSEAR